MKIFIGTDHAGYILKEKLVSSLKMQGYEVVDKGAFEYNESDDYPDFIALVAEEVSKDPVNSCGIILGGNGQGEAIVANRFQSVRAVVYYGKAESGENMEMNIIEKTRQHDNANILSLGARYLTEESMISAVELWLNTPFSGDKRHIRRLKKIDDLKISK